MVYFKHSELVNDYHVSLKTVHNWIDAAKQGKLDLQLQEQNGRTYISNTPQNLIALGNLVDKGKKYRNTLHHKIVSPKAEFYELYSQRQILDIISSLNIHREIPRQYNYMDGGADNWDRWTQRLKKDGAPNILKGTLELLKTNREPLMRLVEDYKKVNFIDIGVGNAEPVREILQYFVDRGLLNRYIAIDISESMLEIAERNVRQWFGDKVKFEGHVRDITYERFDDLLVNDMLGNDSSDIINVVFLLGGTPANFRSPQDVLKVVYGSMGANDLLVYTRKPDTTAARRYFDFNPEPGSSALSPNHSFILKLLNVDDSLYETEMGFNEQLHMRYVQVRLKTALTIKFEFEGGGREVAFEKGQTILLLRVWHQTVVELVHDFEDVGFTLLHSSLTKDREFLMTVSGVAPDLVG